MSILYLYVCYIYYYTYTYVINKNIFIVNYTRLYIN